ncbi:MAG: T9SS type A sorting domain-containing protein [FCB group bacterium]|nr:T9SS type A sorting domain-containing protein [FCB group bacterium]
MMTLSGSYYGNNNTIVKNRSTSSSSSASGAGLCAYSGSSVSGKNNILYLNLATTSPQYTGSVSFTYSCVQGGMTGSGNISSNPMFVHNPPTGYAFLSQTAAGQTSNSPCVDAGDPFSGMITGSTRTDMVQDAGVVDMGFHWIHPYGSYDADLFEDLMEIGETYVPSEKSIMMMNHPNPFNNETVIGLQLSFSGSADIIVTDVSGRIVQTLHQGYLESGYHEFQFDGAALSSGVYFYRATVDGVSAAGKSLLIK